MSDALIDAGLTTLCVSIEGLSTEDYQENTKIAFSFDQLVNNLQYFYDHRRNTKVYIKIIDYMLRGDKAREQRFHKVFDPISDVATIEHLTPTIAEIDYKEFSGAIDFSLTQDGESRQNIKVCPQPFYMLQLNPDGYFTACCSMRYPLVIDGTDKTLPDVWNGEELTQLRLSLLQGEKNEVCRHCTLYQYGTYPEDVLDGHAIDLIKKYRFLCEDKKR